MESDNDRDLEIAGAIADGAEIDWSAVERAQDDALDELRIIAQIAALHRKASDGASTVPPEEPLPAARRLDLSRAECWGPLFLLERVGGGGFAEVHRAWDPALDHEVALKLLRLPPRSAPATNTPGVSRIVREAQLLKRVTHSNVIVVHGALEVNGQVGIWMDFLHGRTLERVVLDDGPMSAAEAAIVGDSLCRALAAVYRGGLLHRDIKASNVMREAGRADRAARLGTGTELATASAATATGTLRIAGTPLYLAPELFEGAAPSIPSDIYSLGVLLFFLVTGSHPVSGRSIADIRSAHQAGRRVLLSDLRSDLPRSFFAVVERALAREPEDRYQSAGATLAGRNRPGFEFLYFSSSKTTWTLLFSRAGCGIA